MEDMENYGYTLFRTIPSFTATYPKSAVIILDTTYFSRTFGVILFQDASSGKILYRKFVKNETNRDYLDGLRYITERGTMIKAVVCDGHVGLLQAISFCPVQMCQFHQFQIVRRLLTNNPHLPAGVELLALMRRMFSMRKEEFITAFDKWCDKWKEFLNERTLLISGKTTYTHRRLRTARRSIKTHLPWIYTCEEYPDMQIPNTTKKVGWNNQPTKCPLLKPERFSAYQMSITPVNRVINTLLCDNIMRNSTQTY